MARQWQLDGEEQARLARKVAGAYRKAMAEYAELPTLKLWNCLLHVERFVEALPQTSFRSHLEAAVANALRRSGRHAIRQKLAVFLPDGTAQIRHQPPLIWRHALLNPTCSGPQSRTWIRPPAQATAKRSPSSSSAIAKASLPVAAINCRTLP